MNLFEKWKNRIDNIKDYGLICGMALSAGDELDDFDRKMHAQFEKVDRLIENPPQLLPLQSKELYDYVSRSLEPGDIVAVSRDWPFSYQHFAVYVGD